MRFRWVEYSEDRAVNSDEPVGCSKFGLVDDRGKIAVRCLEVVLCGRVFFQIVRRGRLPSLFVIFQPAVQLAGSLAAIAGDVPFFAQVSGDVLPVCLEISKDDDLAEILKQESGECQCKKEELHRMIESK
jgi:hypothetical protein